MHIEWDIEELRTVMQETGLNIQDVECKYDSETEKATMTTTLEDGRKIITHSSVVKLR